MMPNACTRARAPVLSYVSSIVARIGPRRAFAVTRKEQPAWIVSVARNGIHGPVGLRRTLPEKVSTAALAIGVPGRMACVR